MGNDFFVALAEAEFELAFRQEKIPFFGKDFPTAEVCTGGVDNDTVPVKDNSGVRRFWFHGK